MSRILEVVFVVGCSLVGLGMNCKEGSLFQNSVKTSIQFVNLARSNVARNAAHFSENLAKVPVLVLSNFR